jgi:hypothetical protein
MLGERCDGIAETLRPDGVSRAELIYDFVHRPSRSQNGIGDRSLTLPIFVGGQGRRVRMLGIGIIIRAVTAACSQQQERANEEILDVHTASSRIARVVLVSWSSTSDVASSAGKR